MRRSNRHGIVIVGPGAIGTLLAVRLAVGGCPVAVLDHRPDRAAAIRRDGLRLRTEAGLLIAPVEATTSAAELRDVEAAIVCVKCTALADAGRTLAALGEPTTLVTIQNGLGVMDALASGLGPAAARHTLVPAVTYQAASPDADGIVRHVANLPTLLDGCAAVHDAATAVAARFSAAGLPTHVEADLRAAIWRKLVVNAAINPLTAIEHVRNGELAERPELRCTMFALAREAAAVARAEGIDLSDEAAEAAALDAARSTAGNVSSMRQDVEAGRPTEVDFLSGAVLRLAARHGLDLPHTRRIVEGIVRCSLPPGSPDCRPASGV
jgi:2-dehydropantoate 2-reductase